MTQQHTHITQRENFLHPSSKEKFVRMHPVPVSYTHTHNEAYIARQNGNAHWFLSEILFEVNSNAPIALYNILMHKLMACQTNELSAVSVILWNNNWASEAERGKRRYGQSERERGREEERETERDGEQQNEIPRIHILVSGWKSGIFNKTLWNIWKIQHFYRHFSLSLYQSHTFFCQKYLSYLIYEISSRAECIQQTIATIPSCAREHRMRTRILCVC